MRWVNAALIALLIYHGIANYCRVKLWLGLDTANCTRTIEQQKEPDHETHIYRRA